MTENINKQSFVSIIVISKDRHNELQKAVLSLMNLEYPSDRYEVVVVEEGDEPMPLKGVKYVFLPRRNLGLGYARNTGVRNAQGEIIAFTDDDCLVDPAWLREIIAGFKNPDVAGVAGATFTQGGSAIGICEDMLGFPGGGHRRYHQSRGQTSETNLLSGCNCAYRKEVFDRLSFKEDGYGRLGADDCLMGITVARDHKCLYAPSAVVYHKSRGSLQRIVTWFTRRRINELFFEETDAGRKNYRSFLTRPHRVVLLRLAAILLLPLGFGWYGLLAVLLIGAAWYLFIFFRTLPLARYFSNWRALFLVPIVRVFMDVGVMIAEWKYLTRNHETLQRSLSEYGR